MIKYSICNAGVVVEEDTTRRAREILTAFHRNESEMQSLAKIPDGFFELIPEYLERLYLEQEEAKDQEPEIKEAISKKVKRTHKQIKEIFSMRIEKILRFAQMDISGDEMQNATKEEWEIYQAIRRIILRYSDDISRRCGLSGKKGNPSHGRSDTFTESSVMLNRATDIDIHHDTHVLSEKLPDNIQSVHQGLKKAQENILIHVKENIPPFSGAFHSYELRRGDISFLPSVVAQILIKRGIAERIDQDEKPSPPVSPQK